MEETEIRNLVQQIISAAPQLSMQDVERAVNSAIRAGVSSSEIEFTSVDLSKQETLHEIGSPNESENFSSVADYPEAFRCTYDPFEDKYEIHFPIVCTPSGQIQATVADNLLAGKEYYCKVSKNNETYSAEIVDSSETDENTVVIVPIAEITENDGIHQKHIGTIIVNESKEYIKGDDTNIVFTKVTSGSDKGKIKIDVYYK